MNYPVAVRGMAVGESRRHIAKDMLAQGFWWDGSKGNSLGCFVKSEDCVVEKASEIFQLPDWILGLHEAIYDKSSDLAYHTDFFRTIKGGITDDELDTVYHKVSADRIERLLKLDVGDHLTEVLLKARNLHLEKCKKSHEWALFRCSDFFNESSMSSVMRGYVTVSTSYSASSAIDSIDKSAESAGYAAHAFGDSVTDYWKLERESLLDALFAL